MTTLRPGDELVYTGDIVEECVRIDMPSLRKFKISIRYLVLAERNGVYDLAMLTLLRAQENAAIAKAGLDNLPVKSDAAPAVRLTLLRLEANGKLVILEPPTAAPPIVFGKQLPTKLVPGMPLDAVNELETGPFPLKPRAWRTGERWYDTEETLRPAIHFTLQPAVMLDGAEVHELTGVQVSEKWEKPILTDRPWRRTERVWVSPSDGIARVVWRCIERQDGPKPAFRIETRLDLQPTPPLRGDHFTSARRDIEFAWYYSRLIAEKPKELYLQYQAQIERYMHDYPASPWREALEAVSRRLAP